MKTKQIKKEVGQLLDFIKDNLDNLSENDLESFMNLGDDYDCEEDMSIEEIREQEAAILFKHAMMCDLEDEAKILAKRALVAYPDCTPAHIFLANKQTDLKKAISHYKSAIAIEEKFIGKKYLKKHKGHFWGIPETRPYMVTLFSMMMSYKEFGEYEEAIKICENMLELNPHDNQGARYALIPLYLTKKMDDKAEKLCKKYDNDAGIAWYFAKALIEYRKNPGSDSVKECIREAHKHNPHVFKYMLDENKLPQNLPEHYGFGDDAEAVTFMHESKMLWNSCPEFIDFIRELFYNQLQVAV